LIHCCGFICLFVVLFFVLLIKAQRKTQKSVSDKKGPDTSSPSKSVLKTSESDVPITGLSTATMSTAGTGATQAAVGKTPIQESTAILSNPGDNSAISSLDYSKSLKKTDTAADSAGSEINSISQDEAKTKKSTKLGLQQAYLDLATVKTTPELRPLPYQGINRQLDTPKVSDSKSSSLEGDQEQDSIRNCGTDPSQKSVKADSEGGSDRSNKSLENPHHVMKTNDGPTETDKELALFSEGDTCISKEINSASQDLYSSEELNLNSPHKENLEPNSLALANKLQAKLSSENEKGSAEDVTHNQGDDIPPQFLLGSTDIAAVSDLPHNQEASVGEDKLEKIQKMSGETTRDIQRLLQTIQLVNMPISLPADHQPVSESVDESSSKTSEHQDGGVAGDAVVNAGDAVVNAALGASEEVAEELVLEEVYQPTNSAQVDDSEVIVVGEIVGGALQGGMANIMADSTNAMEPVAPTEDVSKQTLQPLATSTDSIAVEVVAPVAPTQDTTDSTTVEVVQPIAPTQNVSELVLQQPAKNKEVESAETAPGDDKNEDSDSIQANQSTAKRHKFQLAASFKQ